MREMSPLLKPVKELTMIKKCLQTRNRFKNLTISTIKD